MDLLLSLVGLPHVQLVHLLSKVIRRSQVHVPCMINREGGSLPLRVRRIDVVRHGQLAINKATIIMHAKKGFIEPFEAARGDMSRFITELTNGSCVCTTRTLTLVENGAVVPVPDGL